MRIKVAALSLLFADLILFITCGFTLAAFPGPNAQRQEKQHFALWSFLIVAALLLCLFATVVVVWVWMRRLREQYREESMKNLQILIEGTLQDHERKQT